MKCALRGSFTGPEMATPLELVQTDLAGPIHPESRDGYRYALSYTDDISSTVFVYFLKNKSDTVLATESF